MTSPKRLIEVDLPIGRLSEHSRRDKLVRHGHLSTMHYWWARRPLAACRGVVLAALVPDPADAECPVSFRREAAAALCELRDHVGGRRWNLDQPLELRSALLAFIADFSDWDRSTDGNYIEASRRLVRAGHLALGQGLGERPLVVDPFAGGGAIPLEILRVGAEAFALDINPVAAALNEFLIELAPRYGVDLANQLQEWAEWVRERVSPTLSAFYPSGVPGSVPIAYLWARTVRCEGPRCAVEIPLVRQPAIVRSGRNQVSLRFAEGPEPTGLSVAVGMTTPNGSRPTSVGGSAVCPMCGFVTPRTRVEAQLSSRRGGTDDARLLAVVETHRVKGGRTYRAPTAADLAAVTEAAESLDALSRTAPPWLALPLLPAGRLNPIRPSPAARGVSPVTRYGMETWADLFAPRQARALVEFARAVGDAHAEMTTAGLDPGLARAVTIGLGFAVDRLADRLSSLARWHATRETIEGTFGRQSLAMVWDFAEGNPLSGATGDWGGAVDWIDKVVHHVASSRLTPGHAMAAPAQHIPLPDDSASCVVTDPPYYDQIPYSDLAGLFGEWLARSVGDLVDASPIADTGWVDDELVVNAGHIVDGRPKDRRFFQDGMRLALAELRRVLVPSGIAVIVFAHKETDGWEALIQALIEAGWTVTASWPIETEMAERVRARNAASLQSSIHIVCRPREDASGRLVEDSVGDWREVLSELPTRLGEWMPRLVSEGIVGADAIFACLGPALELFSRFSRVEKASGERVELREYLEHVWAEVARQALSIVFADAVTAGLEADARLTAMWLWTIRPQTGRSNGATPSGEEGELDDEGEEGENASGRSQAANNSLDFDSARKIAQGLGVRLADLPTLVRLAGKTATLLPVRERAAYLLGPADQSSQRNASSRTSSQMTLFAARTSLERDSVIEAAMPHPGRTTLDRVHQGMLVYSKGDASLLGGFLREAAADPGFWRLAQSLSALYPPGSDEKRWVDGVLARGKGLGN